MVFNTAQIYHSSYITVNQCSENPAPNLQTTYSLFMSHSNIFA